MKKSERIKLIKKYIEIYFQDKRFYCGGKVPKNLLFAPSSIKLVKAYDVYYGSKIIHRAFDKYKERIKKKYLDDPRPNKPETNYLLDLLAECSRLKIPKDYASGLIMLKIEFCDGIKVFDSKYTICQKRPA